MDKMREKLEKNEEELTTLYAENGRMKKELETNKAAMLEYKTHLEKLTQDNNILRNTVEDSTKNLREAKLKFAGEVRNLNQKLIEIHTEYTEDATVIRVKELETELQILRIDKGKSETKIQELEMELQKVRIDKAGNLETQPKKEATQTSADTSVSIATEGKCNSEDEQHHQSDNNPNAAKPDQTITPPGDDTKGGPSDPNNSMSVTCNQERMKELETQLDTANTWLVEMQKVMFGCENCSRFFSEQ
uniref:Uncharacterized protein n=1 Tax=Aplanochytrium stocchinoi TaxID=215587 RepID=A0A6S8C181_9STRA